jgi:hypothetical protein
MLPWPSLCAREELFDVTRKDVEHTPAHPTVGQLARLSKCQRRAHADADLLAELLLSDRLYITAIARVLKLLVCPIGLSR